MSYKEIDPGSKTEGDDNQVQDPYCVRVAGLELHVDEDDPRATQTLVSLRVLSQEEAKAEN